MIEGATELAREVEDIEIFQINRNFFNGYLAIKTCEEILGFESNMINFHKRGYQNNRGRDLGGVEQPENGRYRPR